MAKQSWVRCSQLPVQQVQTKQLKDIWVVHYIVLHSQQWELGSCSGLIGS